MNSQVNISKMSIHNTARQANKDMQTDLIARSKSIRDLRADIDRFLSE